MFPEDRVLVGVINRKGDLQLVQKAGWYRIPQIRMKNGINAEYLAFFLSGSASKGRESGVYYYAEKRGLELAYRKDLLPKEADHPRANDVYYKVQLGPLIEKNPPVLNPTRRSISFVYTTWDRFVQAQTIADLYSKDDYFVERIFHALRENGVYAIERTWSAETPGTPAQIRILCERGTVQASTEKNDNFLYLDQDQKEDELLASILARIASEGGPVMVNIPYD